MINDVFFKGGNVSKSSLIGRAKSQSSLIEGRNMRWDYDSMFIKDLVMWRHYHVILENSDITMRLWQRLVTVSDIGTAFVTTYLLFITSDTSRYYTQPLKLGFKFNYCVVASRCALCNQKLCTRLFHFVHRGGHLKFWSNGEHSPLFQTGGVTVPTVVTKTFVFR